MQTRRGFMTAMAAAVPALASGCRAEKLPVGPTLLEDAVKHLKAGQLIREAGIFLLERRCWDVVREVDGRSYGMGCGSYFRWIYPMQSHCPFCLRAHVMPEVDPEILDVVFPLTLNYTGKKGSLNEFESPVWHLPEDDDYLKS